MLRYVSPLAGFAPNEVINRSRSDAALRLSLGTRIGLGTASNDHRVWRLTGSLPLLQKRLAGVVIILSVRFWFGLVLRRGRVHPGPAPAEDRALRGRNPSAVWSQMNGRSGGRTAAARLGQVPAGICSKAKNPFHSFRACGWTWRPMAQTKPLNSRATAAAATCGFLRPRPSR